MMKTEQKQQRPERESSMLSFLGCAVHRKISWFLVLKIEVNNRNQ